ncbi:MAG: PhzF family phenazine biosynthesis protein [Rhodospirillaceae bacterium]|nr:PhzF family phenazine biosynthesis protein [Rhodospirillaceae bacterium]MBT6085633.1 PhzF family phenazine biosynthesis protein [Rhodospirillaceae bacterium]
MQIPIYQIDAFTDKAFGGNPAAVCPLDAWLADETMQAIAFENNLSETAFYVANDTGGYDLRWFTPAAEVDLCGHATLATGSLILEKLTPDAEGVKGTSNNALFRRW